MGGLVGRVGTRWAIDDAFRRVLQRCRANRRGHGRGVGPASAVGEGDGAGVVGSLVECGSSGAGTEPMCVPMAGSSAEAHGWPWAHSR